jgi:hypothetical protein
MLDYLKKVLLYDVPAEREEHPNIAIRARAIFFWSI